MTLYKSLSLVMVFLLVSSFFAFIMYATALLIGLDSLVPSALVDPDIPVLEDPLLYYLPVSKGAHIVSLV